MLSPKLHDELTNDLFNKIEDIISQSGWNSIEFRIPLTPEERVTFVDGSAIPHCFTGEFIDLFNEESSSEIISSTWIDHEEVMMIEVLPF